MPKYHITCIVLINDNGTTCVSNLVDTFVTSESQSSHMIKLNHHYVSLIENTVDTEIQHDVNQSINRIIISITLDTYRSYFYTHKSVTHLEVSWKICSSYVNDNDTFVLLRKSSDANIAFRFYDLSCSRKARFRNILEMKLNKNSSLIILSKSNLFSKKKLICSICEDHWWFESE